MADFNVLRQLLGLATPNVEPDTTFSFGGPPRRISFEPQFGQASGKPPPPAPRLIPGTLDALAQRQGLASDDRFQVGAKLEAFRRETTPDRRRLRDWLHR